MEKEWGGAGTILRAGDSIKGLTTAAGMWTVAGIGVTAGFGMLDLAVTATVVALLVLFGLLPVVDDSDQVTKRQRPKPTAPTRTGRPRG